MNIKEIFVGIYCIFVSNSTVLAEEGEKSPWKSAAELGYVHVSGNTNTETTKASFDLSYEANSWFHKIHAEGLSSNSDTVDSSVTPAVTASERTAAKWLLSGQTDYKFSDLDYLFGLLSYEDDRFSGFQYQAKFGLGYGRRVIHTDEHEMKLEIGPGYRLYRLDQAVPPAPLEETRDETELRLNAAYIWKISKTSKLTEDLTYESGQEQKEWKSVTALTAKINSTLAMKISHTVKHLDKVPVDSQNFDRETAVTLVFTF